MRAAVIMRAMVIRLRTSSIERVAGVDAEARLAFSPNGFQGFSAEARRKRRPRHPSRIPIQRSLNRQTAATSTKRHGRASDWRTRALGVLPTGASTGSKRVESLYGSADSIGPTHFTQAVGCRVTDSEGNEYLDCTMALGAVALGYAETNVTRAVVDAIARGNVSALSSVRSGGGRTVVRRVIPCADKVQFLKTGAEAMAAADASRHVYRAETS
jgi:4-aminobutyrate aminotransferase-like enzyme